MPSEQSDWRNFHVKIFKIRCASLNLLEMRTHAGPNENSGFFILALEFFILAICGNPKNLQKRLEITLSVKIPVEFVFYQNKKSFFLSK